jgi:TPR repeat protein
MMQGWTRVLSVAALVAGVAVTEPANGAPLNQGKAAFSRGNYVRAAQLLAPLARRGNPAAEAMLGFMYEHGLGAPQAYDVAFQLYTGSAEQGDPTGQYLLGLMYDKGHGAVRDDVLAYKWLDLAAAAAPVRERERYLRIRDAVASKMSEDQVVEGQRLAVNWRRKP